MANAIEKLFDEVAAVAQPLPDISWPNAPDRGRDLPNISEILGSPDDLIMTLDDYAVRNRVFEAVADRQIAPNVDPEDRNLISGGLRHKGMDVLAFYRRSCSSDGIYRAWISNLGQTMAPIVAQ